MDDSKDRDEERNKLVEAWHAYGAEFGVFVPQQQPAPTVWDPDVEEFDDKGRINPHYLKHWKYLAQTKDFLRDRYVKYRILQGPALIFDCLIRKYQPRIFNKSYEDQHGNPEFYEVNDSYEWYERAIRMDIFEWQIGFKCRSYLCERDWCLLNRRNAKKIVPVDIYSLVATFEGISVAAAKSQIGKWFGMKLGDFESKGVRPSTRPRRKFPKKELMAVLDRYRNIRNQHVTALIEELSGIIKKSEVVEWHRRMFDEDHVFLKDRAADNLYKIKGPAVKAYVWLLMRQEELARSTRGPKMSVSDSELAEALGVTKRTARNYREQLTKLKLVTASAKKGSNIGELEITTAKY
ncbi:hypothetical protein ACFL2Q_03540 [Thermodesulfobacteriota bacterium]